MDGSQVAKWQDLVSPVGLVPEAGGAEVRKRVSTLRSLGTIEPECGESPNGRSRLCASLDPLSRKGEDRQKAVDSRQWAVDSGKRQRGAAGEGERRRRWRIVIQSSVVSQNCSSL